MKFDEFFLLGLTVSFDFFLQFILFVQNSVLCFDDVHLQYSARSLFLCAYDLNLSSVILELLDDIDQYVFKTLELTSESHRLFSDQAWNSCLL